jgi:hypothetical protein
MADVAPGRCRKADFRPTVSRRQSQILRDRIVTDGHVNQRSILKPPDELVVLDRIDGNAAVAPAKHAVVFRAKSSSGIPVWVEDPFKWWRVVDIIVVGGDALEHLALCLVVRGD